MGSLSDSITISRPPERVRAYLEDLERHPMIDPDGFKNYRFLTHRTSGPSATAAVLVNLLGFWLPAELLVSESLPGLVTFRVTTRVAVMDFKFVLEGTSESTYVWLDVDYRRRHLPPWRIRTRVKQWLRLRKDLAVLCARFLRALRECVERESAGDPQEAPRGAVPASELFPVDPGREFFEV